MSKIFLPTTVASSLRCSNCNAYLSVAPVRMELGNFYCGRCSLGQYRNQMYEDLAQFMYFPCQYDEYGCTIRLEWNAAKAHEEICEYKPILCPIPDCTEQMPYKTIKQHFREFHQELILKDNSILIPLNVSPEFLNSYRILFWKTKLIIVKLLVSEDHESFFLGLFSVKEPTCDVYCDIVLRGVDNKLYKLTTTYDKNKKAFVLPKIILKKIPHDGSVNCEFKIRDTLSFDVLNKSLLDELECPVCFNYMRPPILMCENGHNFCSQCSKKISKCPTCSIMFNRLRNFGLEKVTECLAYPCVNANNGCDVQYQLSDLEAHETFCRQKSCFSSLGYSYKFDDTIVSEITRNPSGNVVLIGIPINFNLSICKRNDLHLLAMYNNDIFKVSLNIRKAKGFQLIVKKVSNITKYKYHFYIKLLSGSNMIYMSKNCTETTLSDNSFTNCLVITESSLLPFIVQDNITFTLFVVQTNHERHISEEDYGT